MCTTYYSLFELTVWYRLRNILANQMKTLKFYTVNLVLEKFCIVLSSSSSIGTTAHCGLWPIKQYPSIFFYLSPTLSIFSLPALEDLFLLPLSILSRVFPFTLSLPVLEWRSFWASYPPSFSPGDLNSLSFALLSILLHFSHLFISSSSRFILLFHSPFSYLGPYILLNIFLSKINRACSFSRVFPFSSLPVLEWRSFCASYPPTFCLGDLRRR